jgi:hypothetical protein
MGPKQCIFFAISFIESHEGATVFPCVKEIHAFISGTKDSYFYAAFIEKPSSFGGSPQTSTIDIINDCDEMVDDGYLSKAVKDNLIVFHTTGKPFQIKKLINKQVQFDLSDVFLQKLTSDQKNCLFEIIKFVQSLDSKIIGECHDDFYGFKLPKTGNSSFAFNWFWISYSLKKDGFLYLKLRETPNAKTIANELHFAVSDVSVAEKMISDVVCKYESITFKKDDLLTSKQKAAICTSKKEAQEGEEKTSRTLDFNHYISETATDVFINSDDASLDALMAVGEASPFFYSRKTIYSPYMAKKLVVGKKNFDFSIRKWKLVAWSYNEQSLEKIRKVLIVGKRSRTLWMVLSISNRKVAIFSKFPFSVTDKDGLHSPKELLKKLFPNL